MQGSQFTAIEKDSIAGRILKQLYPKEKTFIQGLEKTELPENYFDVAISNVPFGNYGVFDKKYAKNNFKIHDYFFAKSLDSVKIGGVVAFITSRGTLDKRSSEFREYIAKRADLIGAIRLPTNSFSNTEVTTDIIFLQKREKMREELPEWVKTEEYFTDVYINKYFLDNPNMVMGEYKETTNQFGADVDVINKNGELDLMLTEAVNKLPSNIMNNKEENKKQVIEKAEEIIEADDNVKDYSYTLVNDKIYYRENSIMKLVNSTGIGTERIKGLIELRDALRELIDIQSQDVPDEVVVPYTQKLNKVYDNFIKKYGYINSNANKRVFDEDSEFPLLSALEEYNNETK